MTRPPRILNVDDDEAGRYAVTHMLRDSGFEVIEAVNGRQALELANDDIDLVLLDVSMPDIDGLEVCRRLKSNPATQTISVVHMSAIRINDYDRVVGLEGGADGYLVEPVGRDELVATLRAHLRARAAEEKARQSEERLRLALEAASLGTWDYDVSTRTLHLDERARGLLPKVQAGEVTVEDLLDCFEEADHAQVIEGIAQGVSIEAYLRLLPECVKKDTPVTSQGVAWRVLRGRVFREGENIVRFSGIVGDSTQRQQLFEETERRNEFERQLMGIVSHDLRNPLSAIQLTGAMLEDNTQPEVAKAGTRILRVSARMGRMIRELLDFTQARLGSGIPINRDEVDLEAVAQRTVDEIRVSHPERMIVVRTNGRVRGELDGDRESHHPTGSGDQHPLS